VNVLVDLDLGRAREALMRPRPAYRPLLLRRRECCRSHCDRTHCTCLIGEPAVSPRMHAYGHENIDTSAEGAATMS